MLLPGPFSAKERISAPFEVRIEASSEKSSRNPDGLLFDPVCFTVTQDHTKCQFDGMTQLVTGFGDAGVWRYTLSIVPNCGL
jgi:uncharacterized protein involved in type VI secretion and phage assembly